MFLEIFSINNSRLEDNVKGYEEFVDTIITSMCINDCLYEGGWHFKMNELKEKA